MLKGTLREDVVGSVSMAVVSLSVYHKYCVTVCVPQILFSFKFEHLKLVFSIPTKSKQRLALDAMCASTTHAGLVHDVTDLVKMAALMAVFLEIFKIRFLNKLVVGKGGRSDLKNKK